jgi:citrate synthase
VTAVNERTTINTDADVHEGLDGILACATSLSDVDGERGRLVIRGHDIERLGPAVSFEDAFVLLRDAALPGPAGRAELVAALGAARARAFARLDPPVLAFADVMDALRAAVAQLAASGDGPDAIEVSGTVAVTLAAWVRARRQQPAVAPTAQASHAADLLAMIDGTPPAVARVRALDTYLVTVADHGLNASTFAARVVASTGSDMVSALLAAICALKGPLHGGAPGPVLDMLDAIGSPEGAEPWLEAELAAGRRIMGMGHRVYRVRDPRAAVFEQALAALHAQGEHSERLALARAVERCARAVLRERYPTRGLDTNVEFYTALLLDAIGLPRTAFTATFAVGRIAGWAAHVVEQRARGRLIRPGSRYVGPQPA